MNTQSSQIDRKSLLSRFGGDDELLSEIAQVLLQSIPEHLSELRHAVAEDDGARVARAAHEIGDAVAFVDAAHCRALALEIETLGRSGEMAHIGPRLADLVHALDRLLADVREIVVSTT